MFSAIVSFVAYTIILSGTICVLAIACLGITWGIGKVLKSLEIYGLFIKFLIDHYRNKEDE